MIVIDASVLVTVLANDKQLGLVARNRIVDEELCAPELIDLEVVSVLRKLVLSKKLDCERAEQAVSDLQSFRLKRVSHLNLVNRCWELHENVTPYDAAYVGIAEALSCILLTADKKLANSPGIKCEVELMQSRL